MTGFLGRRGSRDRVPAVDRTAAALAEFGGHYRVAMGALPNLRLDDAALADRLAGVAALAEGGRLENYSRLTFTTPEIGVYLATIDGELAAGKLGPDQSAKVRGAVNDMVVANALVPTRENKVRDVTTLGLSTLHDRRAIEVMSRADLSRVLKGVSADLVNGRDPCGQDGALGTIGYRETDSLAQRYSRLSLLNLHGHAQRKLAADDGFTDLLNSRILPDALFAASGHNEQNFLNTCTAAAINNEVLARTPTILGLLEVGRGAVAEVERIRAGAPADKLAETDSRSLRGGRMTVGDRADKRITDACAEFDAVAGEVGDLVKADRPGPETERRLAKLTERWGRTMQKVSAVYGVDKGAGEVPVLSKKIIPGAWTASAALAVPHSVTDRLSRRLEGIDDAWGSEVIAKQVDFDYTGDFAGRRPRVSEVAAEPVAMDKLWEKVQQKNGVIVHGPGHAMHVRAIERDGEQIFAVGDPMAAQLKYLDKSEFHRWADQKKVGLNPDDARLRNLLPKEVTAIEPQAPVVAPHRVDAEARREEVRHEAGFDGVRFGGVRFGDVGHERAGPVADAREVKQEPGVARNEKVAEIHARVNALAAGEQPADPERSVRPSAKVSQVGDMVRQIEKRLAEQSAPGHQVGRGAVPPPAVNHRGMALDQ